MVHCSSQLEHRWQDCSWQWSLLAEIECAPSMGARWRMLVPDCWMPCWFRPPTLAIAQGSLVRASGAGPADTGSDAAELVDTQLASSGCCTLERTL